MKCTICGGTVQVNREMVENWVDGTMMVDAVEFLKCDTCGLRIYPPAHRPDDMQETPEEVYCRLAQLPQIDAVLMQVAALESRVSTMRDVNQGIKGLMESFITDLERATLPGKPRSDRATMLGIDRARAVLNILLDRKGFDAWWYNIDADIRDEIVTAMAKVL